jgi:hypothetical protein
MNVNQILFATVCDFKYVGFFKKVVDTEFARNDTNYFTPICGFVVFTLLIVIYL